MYACEKEGSLSVKKKRVIKKVKRAKNEARLQGTV